MADDTLIAAAYRPPVAARVVPFGLGGAVVVLQIAYPLVHGSARKDLAVWIVLGLAATCVSHAAVSRGPRTAVALLLVTAVPGYLVEVLGVHTGFPFGAYRYAGWLGPRVLGVPPLIGLAWTMLAWPAALAARRLVTHPAARVLVGGWALAAADLFLDPQLVSAGAWSWAHPAPHLPGVASVPLTNAAGWLLVGTVLAAGALAVAGDGDDTVAVALYLWLYVGWIVALAAFLDLGAAAAWGAVGMGVVAVPLAWRTTAGVRR